MTVEAQVSEIKKLVESSQGQKNETAEKPVNAAEALEQSIKNARESLIRLDSDLAPAGVEPPEVDLRRHQLQETLLLLGRSVKNVNALAEARKKVEASKTEEGAWSGFKEKPPYSILMVDELLNERDAIATDVSSQEASLANAESLLATAVVDAKEAEAELSRTIQTLKSADEKTIPAAKWRVEAARERSILQSSRVSHIQNSCLALRERVAAVKFDLVLIDRKVAAGRRSMVFSDDDLAKLRKMCDERKSTLKKEIDGLSKRLKTVVANRDQAQADLAVLTKKAETQEGEIDGMELARFRLEVTEDRVDAVQSLKEALEYLVQMEDSYLKVYQQRRDLLQATTPKDRAARLDDITTAHVRLKALENVLTNEQSALAANLAKLDSRAASITMEDPRFTLVNEQRATTAERIDMLQRLQKVVTSQRRLLRRWINEYTPDEKGAGWSDQLGMLGGKVWGFARKIWNFELTHFEEKVEVDGKTFTSRTPLELGTVLKAVLFFLIGYWLLSRIANRIQSGLIKHGHIADAQAKTLRNWGMIFAAFFLVLGTFSFLKIPLTVFAFFGGALAIGIGFGTQTIIKNFISGIILLVERKIRVGDTLEVEGFIGKVTEINTRSSVLRSADDMETIVPNSVFLENRVTNWTLSHAKVRRVLQVGVAYGSPVQQVMDALTESAGRHGLVCKDPAPFAVFQDFGDSALMFHLYYWLDLRGSANGVVVASDIRLMIEKRFNELGIGVPFPQRDLRLSADHPLKILWTKDAEQGGEH